MKSTKHIESITKGFPAQAQEGEFLFPALDFLGLGLWYVGGLAMTGLTVIGMGSVITTAKEIGAATIGIGAAGAGYLLGKNDDGYNGGNGCDFC